MTSTTELQYLTSASTTCEVEPLMVVVLRRLPPLVREEYLLGFCRMGHVAGVRALYTIGTRANQVTFAAFGGDDEPQKFYEQCVGRGVLSGTLAPFDQLETSAPTCSTM